MTLVLPQGLGRIGGPFCRKRWLPAGACASIWLAKGKGLKVSPLSRLRHNFFTAHGKTEHPRDIAGGHRSRRWQSLRVYGRRKRGSRKLQIFVPWGGVCAPNLSVFVQLTGLCCWKESETGDPLVVENDCESPLERNKIMTLSNYFGGDPLRTVHDGYIACFGNIYRDGLKTP